MTLLKDTSLLIYLLSEKYSDISNEYISNIVDILQYIRDIYAEILDRSELNDVNLLLRQAQMRLANMKKRQLELDDLLDQAHSAEISARDTLDKVEQWSLESDDLTKQFFKISNSLNDTNHRLQDLQKKAEDALKKSDTADEHLDSLRELIAELQANTAVIRSMKEELEKTIANADQFTKDADVFIKNATDTFVVRANLLSNIHLHPLGVLEM